MTSKDLRIVYMGTPDFAVAPLRALVEAGYNVVAVVTMPDKPSGRGLHVNESAVKKYAVKVSLPVLQPVKLKDPDFLEQLRSYNADLFIVVAFRMLPEAVWTMPPMGSFNLHASLLPQYRGAAPINWAIINGETESGVTTFFLNAEMDDGAIIGRRRVAIEPEDNAGTLHDKLMDVGTELVIDTVNRIAAGNADARSQDEIISALAGPAANEVQGSFARDAASKIELRGCLNSEQPLKPAPKIFKETCHIDFSLKGKQVVDFIRGLSPYPAAWAELVPVVAKGVQQPNRACDNRSNAKTAPASGPEQDLSLGSASGSTSISSGLNLPTPEPIQIKIFSAEFIPSHMPAPVLPGYGAISSLPASYVSSTHGAINSPNTFVSSEYGVIRSDERSYIDVVCHDGVVRLGEIQPAGKRHMTVREFLNGFRNIDLYKFT